MDITQMAALIEELKWLRAALLNNTVKQVEVECVRRLGRQLSAQEKDLIHRDCLEEMAEIRRLMDQRPTRPPQ